MQNDELNRLIAESREKIQAGVSVDQLIVDLKAACVSQGNAYHIILESTDLHSFDAKRLVIEHPVWKKARAGHVQFHQQLDDLLDD